MQCFYFKLFKSPICVLWCVALKNSQKTCWCYCSKKDIAVGNFTVHEVHCVRNITLCPHCDDPVAKSDLERHVAQQHTKVTCPHCSLSLTKSELEQHIADAHATDCCPECGKNVSRNLLEDHQRVEHSTAACPLCHTVIEKANFHSHQVFTDLFSGCYCVLQHMHNTIYAMENRLSVHLLHTAYKFVKMAKCATRVLPSDMTAVHDLGMTLALCLTFILPLHIMLVLRNTSYAGWNVSSVCSLTTDAAKVVLIEHGLTSAPTQYRTRPTVFTGQKTQPTVSKHWRSWRVVSHPDRPQSNHAHLTVLQ